MARTTNLRSRRNEAQLHALAGVEREIRVTDPSGRRKYLKDFSQAFRAYDSVLNPEHMKSMVGAADLVLVGDYHALPAAQRFAASLLEERAQPGDRPVILGVETIFARDQHILDEWWRREIDDAELRQRIRFDLDWGYDWEPFYQLLVTAREYAEGVYGLDCMPREDLRKIGARDRHAAHKIGEIRERHPNAALVVLFGESHLAPGHLPRLLRDAQVLPIWEGTTNILALDVARALMKERAHEAFFDRLMRALAAAPPEAGGGHALRDALKDRIRHDTDLLAALATATPEHGQRGIREWIESAGRTAVLAFLLEAAAQPALREVCLAACRRLEARPYGVTPFISGAAADLMDTEEVLLRAGYAPQG